MHCRTQSGPFDRRWACLECGTTFPNFPYPKDS